MSIVSQRGLLSFLVMIICAVGWVVSTHGGSAADNLEQVGRFSVVAADGYALLLDTKTGCVWSGMALKSEGPLGTGSSIRKFVLMSVEGLYYVPTSAPELSKSSRVAPDRCISLAVGEKSGGG